MNHKPHFSIHIQRIESSVAGVKTISLIRFKYANACVESTMIWADGSTPLEGVTFMPQGGMTNEWNWPLKDN